MEGKTSILCDACDVSNLCDVSLGPRFFGRIFLPRFKSGFDPESFRKCAGYLLFDILTYYHIPGPRDWFPCEYGPCYLNF